MGKFSGALAGNTGLAGDGALDTGNATGLFFGASFFGGAEGAVLAGAGDGFCDSSGVRGATPGLP